MEIRSLNPQQMEAVTHGQGPIMILAGAGSGKTRVIVHRIAYLIKSLEVHPWHILAVTFTNKAANEMKTRLKTIFDREISGKITVGTFHSICANILRREHRALNLISNFSIISEAEQISRIKRIMDRLSLQVDNLTPRQIISRISKAKNRFEDPEIMESQAGFNLGKKWTAQIFIEYQKQLENDHALDFDDLIIKAVHLLEENTGIREKYQKWFRYILVDEYQDTNHAQYRFISILAKLYRNIMVVGDDDQSIYGWRGAEISNILNFSKDYPGTKIVKLEQNYRSTQMILSAASGLMIHNRNRTAKTLWSTIKGGEKVQVVSVSSDRNEAEFVVKEVRKLQDSDGRDWNDFAVFYRTNAQSRLIEEVCRTSRIPYRIVGQVGFFNRKEVRDLFAYIRLILNPYDSNSCARIINTPRRGIGKSTQAILEQHARENGVDFFTAVEQVVEAQQLPQTKLVRIQTFMELIHDLIRLARTVSTVEFVDEMIERTQYTAPFEKNDSPESSASLDIVSEFQSAARDFYNRTQDPLERFADYLALNQEPLEDDFEEEMKTPSSISLMTLHNAKGLEFPVVFMTGMEEGLCPYYRNPAELVEDELEEERRIAYVGMTRAKERLFMVTAARRLRMGKLKDMVLSRFLKELPENAVAVNDLKIQETHRFHGKLYSSQQSYTPVAKLSHPNAQQTYSRGDRVIHKRWGPGTILELKGSGPSAKVTVSFDRGGYKKLQLGPARLVKVS
jgi:ATP-dependent DNA helicase UvrD/PcrA